MVHFRHRIFFRHSIELRLEQLFLQDWIIEFGISVGQFHTMDEEFKAFRDFRIARLSLGQRTDTGWIIDHKDRTDE